MTTCEMEFLTDMMRSHGKVLRESTVTLMLEFFYSVHQTRPYLTHTMKLIEFMSEIVAE